jgi:hypothetical protein
MWSFYGLNYIKVEDVRVLANSLLSTAFAGGQVGAAPGNTYGWHFVNVRAPGGQGAVVSGFRAMLDLGGTTQASAKVQDSLFENCAFSGGYAAVNVGVSENLFSQVQFDDSTVGALVQQSASPIMIAPLFTQNTTAIGIEGTIQVQAIRLYSPWFEGGATDVVMKKTDAGVSGVGSIEIHSPKFATGNGAGNLIDLTNMETSLTLYNTRATSGNDLNIVVPGASGFLWFNHTSGPSLTVTGTGRFTQFFDAGVRIGTVATQYFKVDNISGIVSVGAPSSAGGASIGDIVMPHDRFIRGSAAGGGSAVPIMKIGGGDLPHFGRNRTAAAVPANFAANFYINFRDSAGNEFFVPAMNAAW